MEANAAVSFLHEGVRHCHYKIDNFFRDYSMEKLTSFRHQKTISKYIKKSKMVNVAVFSSAYPAAVELCG